MWERRGRGRRLCGSVCRAASTSTSRNKRHWVSLRKVLEIEILNYEQGKPTEKAHVTPGGRKVAPRVEITETKHTAAEKKALEEKASAGTADETQVLRRKQKKYMVKVTFDSRQISKTKAQVEVMLLLILEGKEGLFYCQSALLIRTVLVYNSKDGKEQLQANLDKILDEIEDVVRCLRYCTKEHFGQDPAAPMEDGDRNVEWSSSCLQACACTLVSSATAGGGGGCFCCVMPGPYGPSSFGSRHGRARL